MKKRDKNDKIYKIKGSGHPGVVVEKRHRRYTTVPMSTKPTDQGRRNVLMEKNVNPKDSRETYFMTNVRELRKKQLGKRYKGAKLTKTDRSKAKQIVSEHRKAQRRMKRRRDRSSGIMGLFRKKK